MKAESIFIRLSTDTKKRLKDAAVKDNRSLSSMATILIERGLVNGRKEKA